MEKQLRDQEGCKDCVTAVDADYPVNETTVLRPDLAIVCNGEGEKITKIPKAVVKVVLPSPPKNGRKDKAKVYSVEGVKCYFPAHQKAEKIKDFVFKGKPTNF
ncbi:MAG: hypothetical protein GXO08_03600 [Aquificae bacterium]|nr:hypothetical protein [Aquificota bacterium]